VHRERQRLHLPRLEQVFLHQQVVPGAAGQDLIPWSIESV
jgi:hypothetical protein